MPEMSTSGRMSIRTQSLFWAFCFYASMTLVSMAMMNIAAGILLFTMLMNLSKKDFWAEFNRPSSKRYARWSAGLALAGIISLIFAALYPLGYSHHLVEVSFFKDSAKIWYLFWPLVLVAGLRKLSSEQKFKVIDFWMGSLLILSSIGVIQYFTGWPRPQDIPGLENRYHATIFLGHHLSVANILIFPFFIALDFAKEKKQNTLYGLAAFIGVLALFLTYSRMLWISLPIGVFVWILWVLAKKERMIVIAAGILGLLVATQVPAISNRIHNGMGITDRIELWKANWEFFKQRPITGVGWHHNHELSGYYLAEKFPGREIFQGHAHNNWIDFLGSMGVLGLLAYLIWSIGVMNLLLQPSQKFSFPKKGLFCAWIVFHLNGLTQLNFWEGKVEHQIAWVIAWSLL